MSRETRNQMRIGEVSRLSGLPATTIRYYETLGLVPSPARGSNGYREYQPEAVERLRFVRDAQASGLSLDEIQSVVALRSQGESTCHHVVELMERHLSDLDAKIERLRRNRQLYA